MVVKATVKRSNIVVEFLKGDGEQVLFWAKPTSATLAENANTNAASELYNSVYKPTRWAKCSYPTLLPNSQL